VDADLRINAFYWNCAACVVEWVFQPEAAAPTTTTTSTTPATAPPTTAADEPAECIIRGRVTDGGFHPEGPPDRQGHPLVGVRVSLRFDTLEELEVVATDSDGRYEITIVEDDLPFSIDSAVDEFFMSLRLAEAAHDPPRFEVTYDFGRTELWSTPFTLDDDCTDGVIDVDFPLGAIPDDYLPMLPEAEYWDDLGEIYHHIHNATQLADLLGQPLNYEDLIVCAFCAKGAAPTTVFWCGDVSNGGSCAKKPWIGIGTLASTANDPGWPDNREYHEFGHHFQADAFGNAIPGHSVNQNHAGYYVNPYSTDAWTEGFAEFFSIMVTKYIDGLSMPHLYRLGGTPRSLELDYRAWSNRGRYEELALAGILLDLEDGPDDYAQGRLLPGLHIAWHEIYPDPALGTLVVGEVVNNTE
ncbi:MAG: carboxypeptidase-like regulatory domain-containing protein, partial [Actinomycetota bacterium]|nr:carboxypeptidase-like regulatory domain-containing protein [Actinomycetota bacterium]